MLLSNMRTLEFKEGKGKLENLEQNQENKVNLIWLFLKGNKRVCWSNKLLKTAFLVISYVLIKSHINNVKSDTCMSQVASGFCGVKHLNVFLLPPGGDAANIWQGYPQN